MIIQKTLEGEIVAKYKTKTEAAKVLGLNESSIRRAITQNRVVMGRFRFCYDKSDYVNRYIDKDIKILIVDIETAPIKAYVWGIWQQDVNIKGIISDWYMLSWSAKWLGSNDVMSAVLTKDEVLSENDFNIVIKLWHLLDEADIVVAHNGNKFDIPRMNSRFLYHNLMPPTPYKQIDTKVVSKSIFGESSNKLEYLARKFGFDGKLDTTFELWSDCLAGDEESLKKMELYNRNDVVVLENVYLKMRPYMKGHPNVDMYSDTNHIRCTTCGSNDVQELENKYYYTQAVRYKLYRCNSCKTTFRSKMGVPYINRKKVSAIPR